MKQAHPGFPLHIITVVWGEEYVRFFTGPVLESLLWPGNLPSVAGRSTARHVIHTTAGDEPRLRAHPNFRRLAALLEVDIRVMGDEVGPDVEKYGLAAACHRLSLPDVARRGAALMLLSPDCLYADGALGHAVDKILEGYHAVMSASLRAAKEGFEPAVEERLRATDRVPLDSRGLLGLAMDHLHPMSRTHMVDSPTFNTWPSHLYWPAGGEGILARCFHLHPLLVNTGQCSQDFALAMDNDYLAKACPDPDLIHIIADSDRALGIEVSAANQFDHIIRPNRYGADPVAAWARDNANDQHRRFVRTPVRFTLRDPGEGFAGAEAAAGKAVSDILARFDGPDEKRP